MKSIFQDTWILCNFMASNPIISLIIKRMRCVTFSKNIFLLLKDTKTSTLIESKLCGKKKSATEPIRGVPQDRSEECQNELENSMFVDILWVKFFRIPVRRKPRFEKYTSVFIHHDIKQISIKLIEQVWKNKEN